MMSKESRATGLGSMAHAKEVKMNFPKDISIQIKPITVRLANGMEFSVSLTIYTRAYEVCETVGKAIKI